MWKPVLWPWKGKAMTKSMEDSNRSTSYSNSNTSLRSFWDGGLLANTPLRQTYIAHIDYWRRVRKLEDNMPSLRFSIINLHPAKQEYLPTAVTVLLTEKMTSYIMTERNLMKILQFLCLIS